MERKQLILVAAICGGVAAVGTLLPWVSVDSGFMGNVSAAGTSTSYGVLVLLLGLAGGVAALLVHLGKVGQIVKLNESQHLYIALGGLAGALLFTLIQFLSGYPHQTVMGQDFGAHRGVGLWITLIATIAGSAAAFMTMRGAGVSKPPTTPAA